MYPNINFYFVSIILIDIKGQFPCTSIGTKFPFHNENSLHILETELKICDTFKNKSWHLASKAFGIIVWQVFQSCSGTINQSVNLIYKIHSYIFTLTICRVNFCVVYYDNNIMILFSNINNEIEYFLCYLFLGIIISFILCTGKENQIR